MATLPPRLSCRPIGLALAPCLLFVAPALSGGCDTNARFTPSQAVFNEPIRVLGAWPARQTGDGMVRSCGAGPVDGFILNLALTSTIRPDDDPDNAIRPGDQVSLVTVDGSRPSDIKLTDSSNITLELTCVEPESDLDGTASCAGVANPPTTAANLRYQARTPNRQARRNVLFVLDLSGSTYGFVDRLGLNEDNTLPDNGPPENLAEVASDYTNIRIGQLKSLIGGLRETDRLGILAFREALEGGGLTVMCGADGLAGESVERRLRSCFGPGKERWLNGLDARRDRTWGRSNLWAAVAKGWDFMADELPGDEAKHIVVISDGPDTCGSNEDASACRFPCSNVTAADVLQRINTAADDPVQVHVIQFDAPGYPAPDPYQMEVACASGGHYRYVNRYVDVDRDTWPVPSNTTQAFEFQQELSYAMQNLRVALMGHWRLDVASSAWASGAVAPGTIQSVQGRLTLHAGSRMVNGDYVEPLGRAVPRVIDSTLRLRKACGSATDCGAVAGADASCRSYCTAGRLCPGGAEGVASVSNTPCHGGFCCAGDDGTATCLAPGETCAACQED